MNTENNFLSTLFVKGEVIKVNKIKNIQMQVLEQSELVGIRQEDGSVLCVKDRYGHHLGKRFSIDEFKKLSNKTVVV